MINFTIELMSNHHIKRLKTMTNSDYLGFPRDEFEEQLKDDAYCDRIFTPTIFEESINLHPESYRLFFHVMKTRCHSGNYPDLFHCLVRSQWLFAGFIEGLSMSMKQHPGLVLTSDPLRDWHNMLYEWSKYTSLWGVERIPVTRSHCPNVRRYELINEFHALQNLTNKLTRFGDFLITIQPTTKRNEFQLVLFGHQEASNQYPTNIVY